MADIPGMAPIKVGICMAGLPTVATFILSILFLMMASSPKNVKKIEDWTTKLGNTVYIKASKLIKCRIQQPKNFNSKKRYTLLIGLHGNGGSADEFIQLSQ